MKKFNPDKMENFRYINYRRTICVDVKPVRVARCETSYRSPLVPGLGVFFRKVSDNRYTSQHLCKEAPLMCLLYTFREANGGSTK